MTRCIKKQFPMETLPCKDLSSRFNLLVGKKDIALDIVDFNNKNDALLSCADGFIICYAINDRDSFLNIKDYLHKILDTNLHRPSISIIANKSDLYTERRVSSREGYQLAKHVNALFYETSAMLPVIDIRQIFYDLCIAIKNSNKPKKRGTCELEISDLHNIIYQSVIKATGLFGYTRANESSMISDKLKHLNQQSGFRESSLDISII